MAIAWQVFVALIAFTVVVGLVISARRASRAAWSRAREQRGEWAQVREAPGRVVAVFCVALVACAAAGGAGYVLAWAMS